MTYTNILNGKTVRYVDPFWSQTESWRSNRKKYVSDNIMTEMSYSLVIGENEWSSKIGFDRNFTQIGTENRRGYEKDYTERRSESIEETFGEARYTINTMFMLKSLDKFQIAEGLEYRLDRIGNDFDGKNEREEDEYIKILSYF